MQNPFRRDLAPPTANQSIWPWLVVAASCLFWGNVFVRRVYVDLGWIAAAFARSRDLLLRRRPPPAPLETMDRLRTRKRQVEEDLANQAARSRFEPVEAAGRDGAPQNYVSPPESPTPAAAPLTEPPSAAVEEPLESYTERLLQAKRKVRRDFDR